MSERAPGSSNEPHESAGAGQPSRWQRERRAVHAWRPALAATLAALAAVAVACGESGSQPPAQQAQQPTAAPAATSEPVPSGSQPAPPSVPPVSADELRRKRAEWREQQRMNEQAEADVQAWRRSRRSGESGAPIPRVSEAQAQPAGGTEQATASAMDAWYDAYKARAAAVSLALSQVGKAAGAIPPDQPRLLAACSDLGATSRALLADSRALAAPLESVALPLAAAYGEIKAMADACLALRREEQAAHFAAARRSMAAAATALLPYHLAP
jgi:hypothetical protein